MDEKERAKKTDEAYRLFDVAVAPGNNEALNTRTEDIRVIRSHFAALAELERSDMLKMIYFFLGLPDEEAARIFGPDLVWLWDLRRTALTPDRPGHYNWSTESKPSK
jgi:hypothetical protein